MEKIIIYTNEACPYCKTIKERLNKEDIKFTEIITKDNNEWKKVSDLTGIPSVPTLKYKDEYLVPNRDYNSPDSLVTILKTLELNDESNCKRAYERIKTLNYNISVAFMRLDKALRDIENKIK